MSRPVPPVSPVARARPVRRRLHMFLLRRNLEEYAEPAARPDSGATPKPPLPTTDAGVAAQLLGERERRGLRAGYEVREQARASYLEMEYAGPRDRRARKGRITRTDV